MTIAGRLRDVETRIAEACAAVGRDPSSVRLLPVSKTRPISDISTVNAAGYTRFGENRPQELADKATELAASGIEFAAIGRLQTNKARLVAEHASEFQALDSLRLADELNKRCQRVGRQLDVLVQVNSSSEPQKGGLAPSDVADFARELVAFDALRVRGLMTLALFSDDPMLVGACFERLVEVQRRLRDDGVPGEWSELSMGMSNDFELAIAKGATCVRIGTAIFGARSPIA